MVRNTMVLVKQADNAIDIKYDIFSSNIEDIYTASNNRFDMIVNGFKFGYMQGMKAAKSEMKKGGVAV